MLQQDEILSTTQVAQWLLVSRAWVLDHASSRRKPVLPGFRAGKLWRFRKSDVEAWIDEMAALAKKRAA